MLMTELIRWIIALLLPAFYTVGHCLCSNLPQLLAVLLPPFFISHLPFLSLPPGLGANGLGPPPRHLGFVPASLAGRFLGHWPC